MIRINRKVRIGGLLIIFSVFGYLGLLIYPNFLFGNHYIYKNFDVYSDQKIPVEINAILDEVLVRIRKSELYDNKNRFSIYFCNSSWRLSLFTRNPNIGGLVNQGISNNIFIRESEIEKNKIVSPSKGQEIALVEERPLTYFIAHEITHSLQTKLDRFMYISTPEYIVEGYADYIGKGSSIDYKKYVKDFKENDFTMNPNSGLYNKYHLMIAYLMDIQGMSFREIVHQKINIEEIDQELKRKL
jgi:hypothetical protein